MIHTITNLQHIEDVWGAISEYLEPCFDERCTKQNVYDNLMSGEWTLLSITDGDKPVVLATVSYVYYPNSTSLNLILLILTPLLICPISILSSSMALKLATSLAIYDALEE